MSESQIQALIRSVLNGTNLVRLVRNAVGKGYLSRAVGDPSPPFVSFGLGVGSPDLIGPLRSGVIFAIEVKTPEGRASKEQLAWWRAARKWGIRGGFARSLDQSARLLYDALDSDGRALLLASLPQVRL